MLTIIINELNIGTILGSLIIWKKHWNMQYFKFLTNVLILIQANKFK